PKVWLDGALVDWDAAAVHVSTHSLHYGVGVFGGIRCYKRADGGSYLFRLREHIDRLFYGCKMVLIRPCVTKERMMQACVDEIRENRLDEGYLRPMVFIGDGGMGLYCPENRIRATIIASPAVPTSGAASAQVGATDGIRAKISSFARHHINASL